jgi:predicted  nucleic acid-binding Zn-ribbon protein
MIEMTLFFGLGFLAACIAAIFVDKEVWRRAVRLTRKHVEEATPASLAEIKAEHDQRRSDSTALVRKLEASHGEVKQMMQREIAEITKKNEHIRLLMLEAETKADLVRGLEQREEKNKLQLLKTENDLSEMTHKFRETEKNYNNAQIIVANRDEALTRLQSLSELRTSELTAANLKISHLEAELAAKHKALTKSERELIEARAASNSMVPKFEALERTLQAKAKQTGEQQAKITELTTQLRAQIDETERAIFRAQNLLGERHKVDEDLMRRASEAELRLKNTLDDMEKMRSERAVLEGQLTAAREERNRLSQDIKLLQPAPGKSSAEGERATSVPGTIWPS